MKRGRNAVDGHDESEAESPAKRVAHDVTLAEPTVTTTQPWTKMFSSILGAKEPHYHSEFDVNLSSEDETLSIPFRGVDPVSSLGNVNSEEVGRRIGNWADATISDCVEAQRQDAQSWRISVNENGDLDDDRMQCFGMIHNCRTRLYGDMQSLRQNLTRILSPTKTRARLHFITISDTGFLRMEDGTLSAQLEHRLHDPLKRIAQVESTRLIAYASVEDWISIIDHARRHKDVETNIDINIYGPASVRSAIGLKLSEDGLYLQNIKYSEEDAEYMNPHMLTYEDCDQNGHDSTSDKMDLDAQEPEDIQQTILQVCLAETRDRHFQEYQGCVHVKVPYYLHQKQAVPFMIEREIGPVRHDARLWKWTEDKGRSGYRNLITGCWAAEPHQEIGGGILADDPGMGKTLSTLSLIGQRLTDAQEWSKLHEENHEMYGRASVRSKATLVVVPSLPIITEWLKQINMFMDGSLKVLKYHGRSRCKQMDKIADADIVFTTYHTLAVERKTQKSPLRSIKWFRIVLDEAHYIRRQATTLYAAVTELDACHRWCLTGTPIQNKLEDLGALLAFIRADSFASISMFRKYIVSAFSYDLEEAKEKLSLLLNSICMRRSIRRLDLPSVVERRHDIELSSAEREQYTTTLKSMFWELTHGSREKYSGTPFGKFQIQLQLRRLCNHGTFQKAWKPGHMDIQAQREDAISSMGKDGEVTCVSCQEPIPLLSACYGSSRALQSRPNMLCDECKHGESSATAEGILEVPACVVSEASSPQSGEQTTTTSSRHPDISLQGYSSKLDRLMQDVSEDLTTTKR